MRMITLLIFGLLITNLASAQISKLFEKLPADSMISSLKVHAYSENERMALLAELIDPLSIRYVEPSSSMYDEEEETQYFELDTHGVYLIDLNMDKQLDLIYTAQSGNMGMMTTAIYLNENGKLYKDTLISGGLIEVYQNGSAAYSLYTLWTPCCDSYTNRLERYSVSSEGTKFEESISYVGRTRLSHVPDFMGFSDKKSLKKGSVFYAMKLDFRNVHPYFRKNNKAYWDELKKNKPVALMTVSAVVDVIVLGELVLEGVKYYAVLTEMIIAEKSHYEWSVGVGRRFVGWVTEGDLE